MAQKKQDGLDKSSRRVTGRKSEIDTDVLLRRRDWYVFLFERYWHEFGWQLRKAKTPSEIGEILGTLNGMRHVHEKLPFSAGLSSDGCSATQIRKTAAQLRSIAYEYDRIRESLDKQKRSVEDAISALRDDVPATAEETAQVRSVLEQRQAWLREIEVDFERVKARQGDLTDQWLRERCLFSQIEVWRFFQRGYRITPRTLANALAGLPEIGCRQSFNRCQKIKSELSIDLYYSVFLALEIVFHDLRCIAPSELARMVENRIRALPKKHAVAQQDLAKNWFYLKPVLESNWQGISASERSYRVTSAYVALYNAGQTSRDRVHAELEALKL